MKLKNLIFLFPFVLINCKKEIKNYHYPSYEKISKIKIDTLNLSEYQNYDDFISKLENLNFKGNGYGLLRIKNNNNIHNLKITTRHGFCFNSRLVKQKNLIIISEDSILKNDNLFHIESLSSILKKDLQNNGKDKRFADNSEKLKISFVLKNHKNFNLIENYLMNIIDNFNKLNKQNEYELNIQIDRKFYYYRDLFKNLPK